ncbi:MAG: hypothetical protein ABIH75_01175 [Candidatus Omnitrophota bacterium]
MKILKHFCIVVLTGFCVAGISGCATVGEAAKGFMGISTRALEEGRKDAIAMTFTYDYPAIYAKIKEILTRTHAYIYAQSEKKHMIAFYISEEDTTVVGIFFKEIDANNTQVEVSSRSTYAKELISGRIFSVLDGTVTLDELEAKINANEEEEEKDTADR